MCVGFGRRGTHLSLFLNNAMQHDSTASQRTTPFAFLPRGLRRTEAAAYICVSPSLFDDMVKDGRMPSPRVINTRTVWDRIEVDEAFEALPRKEAANPWDA